MLTLYRRHLSSEDPEHPRCLEKLKAKGMSAAEIRTHMKCSCPIWVMGVDDKGRYRRESLKTADEIVARERRQRIELGLPAQAEETAVTVAAAFERVKTILASQKGLKPQSIASGIEVLETLLVRFLEHKGVRFIADVTTDLLDEWVGTWEYAATTRAGRMAGLKQFFSLCASRGLIEEDPTLPLISSRRPAGGKTKPFDLVHEDPQIVAAIPHWEDGRAARAAKSIWYQMPRTASAVLMLLRYTGLRISDAMLFEPRTIERRELEGREVHCYLCRGQKKTEHPVFLPLRPAVAGAILGAERISKRYAFWDGETELHNWYVLFIAAVMVHLERLSGVDNIHPHRFRDTFAVELLSRGADIRSVSRLLGHKEVGTTLRYYEHWIPADQERLIKVAMSAW